MRRLLVSAALFGAMAAAVLIAPGRSSGGRLTPVNCRLQEKLIHWKARQ
jgi:hypothetical protein